MTSFDHLSTDIIEEISRIVFEEANEKIIQPCDVIFVFGGSHPGLWEKTAEAYFNGMGKHILITGGHKPNVKPHYSWIDGETPEALVIRRELIKLKIPEDVIFYEDRSTNSLENVQFAKEVFDFSQVTSILVVCKNYGAGRQCRTLRKQIGANIKVVPYPFETNAGSNGPIINRHNWTNDPICQELVFREMVKIHRYGSLGHLEAVEHLSDPLKELLQL